MYEGWWTSGNREVSSTFIIHQHLQRNVANCWSREGFKSEKHNFSFKGGYYWNFIVVHKNNSGDFKRSFIIYQIISNRPEADYSIYDVNNYQQQHTTSGGILRSQLVNLRQIPMRQLPMLRTQLMVLRMLCLGPLLYEMKTALK